MNDVTPVTEKRRKIPSFPFVIFAAVNVGLLTVPLGIIFLAPLAAIYHADEGFKRARKTINPEELRRWALQEISKRSGTNDSEIPASEIPDYIQKLYSKGPEEVLAFKEPGGASNVVIIWGSGFFHWVMDIGDTNCSEPYVNEDSEYRYSFEWTNGIYYTREARWKLW